MSKEGNVLWSAVEIVGIVKGIEIQENLSVLVRLVRCMGWIPAMGIAVRNGVRDRRVIKV